MTGDRYHQIMRWIYALKKAAFNFCLCVIVWFAADRLAAEPRYAGWIAAFVGACYLLAGWLQYLKSNHVDIVARFRRRKSKETPYFLRGEKQAKTRIGFNGNRHDFDDDMETAAEAEDDDIPVEQRRRLTALVYLIVGIVALCWSQLAAGLAG